MIRPLLRPGRPALVLGLFVALGACTGTTGEPQPEGEPEHNHDDMLHLHMAYEHLPELGPDYAYKAFTVDDDGTDHFVGRFQSDPDHQVFGFDTAAHNLEHATSLLIAVADDLSETIGPRLLLGGDFDGEMAHLHLMHDRALGMFPPPGGAFIADSPGVGAPDDTNGVWFFDPVAQAASLTLPVLAGGSGWTWEGWVRVGDAVYSTGRFLDGTAAEPDQGVASHPAPGENFVDPAVDVAAADEVFITLEPADDMAAPFAVTVLSADPAGAAPDTAVPLAPWAMPPFEGHAQIAAAGSHNHLLDAGTHEH